MPHRRILTEHRRDVALVIGNGVNRYRNDDQANSWDALLLRLARRHNIGSGKSIPDGITLTEFYDLLELQGPAPNSRITSLQKEFCEGMERWQPYSHHDAIVRWAIQNRSPILTTNFDDVLAQAGSCRLLPDPAPTFTDYYPWELYFGNGTIEGPDQGFGIWHINGMKRYRRSIRLGLSHYMGSVERVRGWLHKGNERRLFSGKNASNWLGKNSWLHIVFNRPLLIFGLALEQNEVFLRWLLIERARYFRKFPDRQRQAWYVYSSSAESEGKLYFLERIGIKPIKVDKYDDIYSPNTWR